ncbi:52 kDa repressor of the inhibitor of the protein kinase-like [Protopterus annectens]|uniref:52 kDa repressor of the inhibitor of the protein kinase-like n=1 Tax=Protopterus annectens TaxID=7888 RepID=UPI001CFBACF6|nr:52 kDa repressor of the inhibitor of the protein kinase-like [Protopterus annectens]
MTDWSNAKKILERHSNSKEHGNAVARSEAFLEVCCGKMKTALHSISQMDKRLQERTLHALKCIVKIIILCGRENLPLRGRLSDSGTFKSLLQYTAELDPLFAEHLQKAHRNAQYISAQIQNELIQLISLQIQRNILNRVKDACYFSLIADGTTDISRKEQITLTLRYVHHTHRKVEIREDFIEFVEAMDTTGKALADLFLQRMTAWGLDKGCMRGQGYDRGSNMSGHFSGVQARIRALFPEALYSACKAHNLNTAIVHSCAMREMANALDTCRSVIATINSSAKRHNVYLCQLKEFASLPSEYDDVSADRSTSLRAPGATRWMSQADCLHAFKMKYAVIASCLENMAEFDKEAERYLYSISKFDFIVELVIMESILGIVKPLHLYFQREQIDLIQASEETSVIVETLKNIRSDADRKFKVLYEEVQELASQVFTEESVPRICGRQTKRSNITASNPEEYYRRNTFIPFLDHVIAELTEQLIECPRFLAQYLAPKSLYMLQDDAKVIELYEAYKTDLSSLHNLREELVRWSTKWNMVPENQFPTTIIDTLQHLKPEFYPDINTALSILATMPVSVASAERTFSAFRRIKTWLRNCMSEHRLTGLALMHIHDDIDIDIEQVLRDFNPCNDRRINLFPA